MGGGLRGQAAARHDCAGALAQPETLASALVVFKIGSGRELACGALECVVVLEGRKRARRAIFHGTAAALAMGGGLTCRRGPCRIRARARSNSAAPRLAVALV